MERENCFGVPKTAKTDPSDEFAKFYGQKKVRSWKRSYWSFGCMAGMAGVDLWIAFLPFAILDKYTTTKFETKFYMYSEIVNIYVLIEAVF